MRPILEFDETFSHEHIRGFRDFIAQGLESPSNLSLCPADGFHYDMWLCHNYSTVLKTFKLMPFFTSTNDSF